MFFSIIIPVYNAEKTLEKCLNSLCRQSFADFEVLMTDDGSRDGSFLICAEFAKKDARFSVERQENRGPSAARNNGLNRAKGRYLCFIDSDDYVMPDYLSRLFYQIENTEPDVVFFGYHKVDRDGRVLGTFLPPEGMRGTALLTALSERDMFGYTWIKSVSRRIAENCRFPEDMSLFEDEVFTCAVLEKTENVAVLPEALYCYVIGGENMLTDRTRADYCDLSDRVFAAWERLAQNLPDRDSLMQRKANSFVGRCRYYGMERDVDTRYFFEALSKTRFFQYHTDWTATDRFVRNGNWLGVRLSVLAYRWKNGIRYSVKCV